MTKYSILVTDSYLLLAVRLRTVSESWRMECSRLDRLLKRNSSLISLHKSWQSLYHGDGCEVEDGIQPGHFFWDLLHLFLICNVSGDVPQKICKTEVGSLGFPHFVYGWIKRFHIYILPFMSLTLTSKTAKVTVRCQVLSKAYELNMHDLIEV